MKKHPELCQDQILKYMLKQMINPQYHKMSQQVAKIINFNIDERFDFAMIVEYIDPESGEKTVKWEKLYYFHKDVALPIEPLFKEPHSIRRDQTKFIQLKP